MHDKYTINCLFWSFCLTLLYLVLGIGGVHDAAQLPAGVNHNPHHCALRQRQKRKSFSFTYKSSTGNTACGEVSHSNTLV